MLDLSCADYTFPLLGRREALALLRLLGFDSVDIGLFARSPNYLPSELQTSSKPFIEGVHNELEAAGLRAADVFLQVGEDPSQLSANDPEPRTRQAARDMFSRALELCSAIQCRHITGLPGVLHGERSRDFECAVREAAWRVQCAASADITFAIEPHLGSICAETKTTHELLSQVPELTLTLDYGHFIFQGESNEAIHTLLPRASHLHLRGAAPGRLQTPVCESTIDLPHILRTFGEGEAGICAFEYVWSDWHNCNRTDNLSETLLLRRRVNEILTGFSHGATQHV